MREEEIAMMGRKASTAPTSFDVGLRLAQRLFTLLAAVVIFACHSGTTTTGGPTARKLGGTVMGLQGELVLLNGSDAALIQANGAFVFAGTIADGANYSVSVGIEPTGQMCTIANATGQVSGQDVTDIFVSCISTTGTGYSVGGFVSGLGSTGVTLLLDNTESLTVTSNGGFNFPAGVPDGSTYFVTIVSQPTDAQCAIQGAAGTIASANISSVLVKCASTKATLSSLVVSAGQLSPMFSPSVPSYQDQLGVASATLEITITPSDPNSTILVNGLPASAGLKTLPIPLTFGMNVITIGVTATAGNTKSYTIVADRASSYTYVKADTPTAGDNFGKAVAVQGTVLVVGSPNESGSGAVYVYRRTGSTWAEEAHLHASNGSSGYGFGTSVAVDGNTIVVGSPGEPSDATGLNGDQTNIMAPGSGAVYVFELAGTMWNQTAYVKASNTKSSAAFGQSVAIRGTLFSVGAAGEGSSSVGVNGDQTDNSVAGAGAVYVFTQAGGNWTQTSYIKASNTGLGNAFGSSLSMTSNLISVGSPMEPSSSTGINGNQSNKAAPGAGAVYVFGFSGTTWAQQAYVKPSNTNTNQLFGTSVSLSGTSLVVGAPGEASNAVGIGGNQADTSVAAAGAAYVFTATGTNWAQQAYVKPSNTDAGDHFGTSVAIEEDTMLVGSPGESSNAKGVNGTQTDNSAAGAGAVYIYARNNITWVQQAYVKASNTDAGDGFGSWVSLGLSTFAAGSPNEASAAGGLNGDQSDNSTMGAGAVYLTP